MTFPQAAFVLALAQGSVRLVEVAAEVPASEDVRIADLPATSPARSARRRSPTGPRSAASRAGGAEGPHAPVRAAGRRRAAAGARRGRGLPLILAAAEPLESIYRSVNSYPYLAPQTIQGNPETATAAELAEEARGVLDALYAEELSELRRLFEQRGFTGARGRRDHRHRAGGDVRRRADAMADMDDVVSGFVDEESGAVTIDADGDATNYGVVDEIARRVIGHGGRVLALRREDIPGGGTAAAILRYPV